MPELCDDKNTLQLSYLSLLLQNFLALFTFLVLFGARGLSFSLGYKWCETELGPERFGKTPTLLAFGFFLSGDNTCYCAST